MPSLPRRFANYGAATGFLIVVVLAVLEQLFPATATLPSDLVRLSGWLCPLAVAADGTGTPWWGFLLLTAAENVLLYAVLGLVIGLAAVGVRRLASRHHEGTAED